MIAFIVRLDVDPGTLTTESLEEMVQKAIDHEFCHYDRQDDTKLGKVEECEVKVMRIL